MHTPLEEIYYFLIPNIVVCSLPVAIFQNAKSPKPLLYDISKKHEHVFMSCLPDLNWVLLFPVLLQSPVEEITVAV